MSTPSLWLLHSRVLAGFYQSHVIVMASDRAGAIEQAVQALTDHIDQSIDEMYTCSIDGQFLDPTDEDYIAQRAGVLERFRQEAGAEMKRIETGRIVMHSN